MGIPCMVHESNALPGVAVRQLQRHLDVILTNFAETAELLKVKEKVVNVGNPLRARCGVIGQEEARRQLGIPDSVRFVVLSFGGSLGAPALNEAAVALMRNVTAHTEDMMHIHATGARRYDETKRRLEECGLQSNERLVLKDYIDDMPLYMAAADLVICRAGAMTLTEVAMMRKPVILIPSPNVTDNHQYKNAKVLADADAAELIEEKDLTEDRLQEAVCRLASDEALRQRMSENIARFAREDAGLLIYKEIMALLRQKEVIVSDRD